MRKLAFVGIIIFSGFLLVALFGELVLRFFNPQPTIYPRFKYSPEYGATLYENAVMVHSMPGRYRYQYTINEYGYRGRAVPISNSYTRKNIVVLGDSYAFGDGVNDGQEFSAVMQQRLQPEYAVVNLGVPGFGLTQEIRKFYEFGRLYDPSVVVLQFCANDPSDNLYNKVTEIEDGRFAFRRSDNPIAWTKQYLSRSMVQKSQLYNFLRQAVYLWVYKKELIDARERLKAPTSIPYSKAAVAPEEGLYNALLETFAKDLKRRGIRFLLIAVNGQLSGFPAIAQEVETLNTEGSLEYVEVAPWFSGESDYGSPEGHSWGAKAHAILGINLARVIRGR